MTALLSFFVLNGRKPEAALHALQKPAKAIQM